MNRAGCQQSAQVMRSHNHEVVAFGTYTMQKTDMVKGKAGPVAELRG